MAIADIYTLQISLRYTIRKHRLVVHIKIMFITFWFNFWVLLIFMWRIHITLNNQFRDLGERVAKIEEALHWLSGSYRRESLD